MSRAEELSQYEECLKRMVDTFIHQDLEEGDSAYLNRIVALLVTMKKLVMEVSKEETFFDDTTNKE